MDHERLQIDKPETDQGHGDRGDGQNPASEPGAGHGEEGGDYYRRIGHCAKPGKRHSADALSITASKNGGAFVSAANIAALKMFDCQVTAVDQPEAGNEGSKDRNPFRSHH